MHSEFPTGTRRIAALLGAIAILAGAMSCTGEKGDTGPAGAKGDTGAAGAKGDPGDPGDPGEPAPTTGVLTGTVTDAVNGLALGGVAVAVTDTGGGSIATATTNDSGNYSVTVPFGVFVMKFSKTDFTAPAPLTVGCIPGNTVTINVTMAEASSGKPTVTLTSSADAIGYGNQATLTATATDPQGDPLTYTWTNATVPVQGTVTGNGTTGTVTMPTMEQAFAERQNPTNPGELITAFKVEPRFGILPILPDYRAQISARVTVSDGRGQSTAASLTVNAASVQTGLPTVAQMARVYLNAGTDATPTWTLTSKPTGSTASLLNANTRFPSFVPDLKGTYKIGLTYSDNGTMVTKSMDIEAGDWTGVIGGTQNGVPVADATCTTCHNGAIATGQPFEQWPQTAHATIFADGINGLDGTSGAGCLDCHTVGYDKGAANGGFDDVAKNKGWTFPMTRVAGTWEAMFQDANTAAVAKLANIQCESCHGPNSNANHMKTPENPDGTLRTYESPRISFAAETCGTCHARTSHHLYSEWNTTNEAGIGHSNLAAAQSIGARGGTLYGHCGRCHAAQGYVQYAENLKSGNIGNITKNLTDVTTADVQPVTCQACHDSHDATNPRQLRIYNDIAKLPSGFGVSGFGKGALCASCHNSRNGLHNDSNPPPSFSAPHVSAQADVFAGQNAYFVNLGASISDHSAIEDTCVGCHMERNPQTRIAHGETVPQTHLFRINDADVGTLCQSCHADGVTGEALREAVEHGLHNLAAKLELAAAAKLTATGLLNVRAYDAATDLYSSTSGTNANVPVDLTANPLTHVEIIEGHGQVELHLTFTNPITVQFVDSAGNPAGPPKAMTDFGVQLGSIYDNATPPARVYQANSNFMKASWNYFLIHADASEGVHNPSFTKAVLNNTLAVDVSN